MESHSHRNVHEENPYRKYRKSFAQNVHDEINGSHSHRNTYDENPFRKKWQSFSQKRA